MTRSLESSILEYEPLFGSWHVVRRIGTGSTCSVYEIEREDDPGASLRAALKAIAIPAGGEEEVKALRFSGMSDEDIRSYYMDVVVRVVEKIDFMVDRKGTGHLVRYEEYEVRELENEIGWIILTRLELLTPMLDYLDERELTESEVIKIGTDLCEGLEACSRYGIVHRDIKPANIFVAGNGDYELGDFGVARIVEETQTVLSRKGTYTYMAPEVYRGDHYDQTADIYSLGMVLYQCLNDGRNMFVPAYPERIDVEDNENAFAKRIKGCIVPPPSHGTDELITIVLRACAYNKDERYQSAAEMRRDLEALRKAEEKTGLGELSVESSGITAASNTKPAVKTKRSRKVLAAAAVIAVIAVASAATIASLFPWSIDSISAYADGEELVDGTEIYIGEDLAPEYRIEPEHYAEDPIEFTSSDESVLSVDDEGIISAESLGDATITMWAEDHTEEGYTTEIRMCVVPKVTAITLMMEDEEVKDSISMTTGYYKDVTVVLAPEKFSEEKVKIRVKDKSVVKADLTDEDGSPAVIRLTALKAGETTLRLSSGGCKYKTKIVVSDPVIVHYSTGSGSSGSKKKSSSGGSSGEGTFGNYEYFD